MKYRKKPIIVDAMQYDGTNSFEICMKLGMPEFAEDLCSYAMLITTPEGEMRAIPGDYIVKGVKGEFYPVKKDIFELIYDLMKEAEE